MKSMHGHGEKRVDGSGPNAEVTIVRDGFAYFAFDP
jgi:hypothetical protein